MIRINSRFATKHHGVWVMARTTWTLLIGGTSPKWLQVRVDPNLPFDENWRLFGDDIHCLSSISVILSPQYYDLLSCDPPSGSTVEWRQNLPFSLADQVTFPPSDMTLLPWAVGGAWQTAVMQTSCLNEWTKTLQNHGICLSQAIPMHFVWAGLSEGVVWQDESSWHLSVFDAQTPHFQRQLRGFDAHLPDASARLTQEMGQSERFLQHQCESWTIAGEIAPLCVDDVSSMLSRSCTMFSVESLNDAPLAVQMAWLVLSEQIRPMHWRLADWQASKTAWQRWQNAIVAVSLLSVSAMVGGVSYYFYHLDRLVTQQESENRQLMARLKAQTPSPLKGQVSLLSEKVAQQQRDLQALAALDDLNGQGFSDWLTALGQSMTGEIQVTNFTLNGEKVALDGFAKHSDSVPSWIAQFPRFSALKSTDLQGLTLNRDEKGRLQFSLTSEAK